MGGKTKLAVVTTYMKGEEKSKIEKIAQEEERTVSNLVAKILRDWLKKQKKA